MFTLFATGNRPKIEVLSNVSTFWSAFDRHCALSRQQFLGRNDEATYKQYEALTQVVESLLVPLIGEFEHGAWFHDPDVHEDGVRSFSVEAKRIRPEIFAATHRALCDRFPGYTVLYRLYEPDISEDQNLCDALAQSANKILVTRPLAERLSRVA